MIRHVIQFAPLWGDTQFANPSGKVKEGGG